MAVPIESFYSDLGTRISEMRRKRGMTQERLGASLNPPATRASIANIESGKQRVLSHTLLQLAQALQVEVVHLLNIAPAQAAVKGRTVANELKTKLNLPPKQLQRLGRELGLTEKQK